MRIARAVVALVLCGKIVVPSAGVEAAHWMSCEDEWRTPGSSCLFALQGLPVTVFGWAEASGTASVKVEVMWRSPTGLVELVSCEAQGQGFATCSERLEIFERVNPFVQTVPLECHVSGTGQGRFICASYAGEEPP